jgi:hypothetical protein
MLGTEVSTCVDYAAKVLLGPCLDEIRRQAAIAYQTDPVPAGDRPVVQFIPSGLFGNRYGTPASLPKLPLRQIEGVPLLYGTSDIRREGNRLLVRADLIASTYFMVTRYEEMVRRGVRDEHGRFPGRESLPCRAGFLDRPIVEAYSALLRKWLREIGVNVPELAREFTVLLTHDVDRLRRYRRPFQPLWTTASALAGRQPMRNIPESVMVSLGLKSDPYDTFDRISALDRAAAGARSLQPAESVYFFMSGGTAQYDNYYDVRSPAARETINRVRRSGAEIGLHASYQAGMHPELVAQEKDRLEEASGLPIRRNRHHYLAWREIEDGWRLREAGIDWDSTLGYADVAGFRLGVCHPIPLFDPATMRPFEIEEHPLIFMDTTLHDPSYMGLDAQAAFDYCRRLILQTAKYRGELVILWHTNTPAGIGRMYHLALYRRLLDCARTQAAAGRDGPAPDAPVLQAEPVP